MKTSKCIFHAYFLILSEKKIRLDSFQFFIFAKNCDFNQLITNIKHVTYLLVSIVYRDLKPDNIGFDVRGDIKLFDFGLAKTLEAKDLVDDTTYKLTGNTGSLLYMAPEVFHNKPYNTKVDIYSFGILYWQICAMESPFPNFTCKMIEDLVLKEGYRPSVMDGWSWGDVMKSCWANDISVRPSAEDLLKSIGELLVEVSGASNFKDRTRSSLGS